MSQSMNVARYLIERLKQIGVKHLFAIPGDYNAPFLDVVDADGELQRIGDSNEMNAGYATDGYARINGVGALTVTYGVGAFSTLNAVAGAYVEQVPLIIINGAPSSAKRLQQRDTGLLWHHMIDERGVDMDVFRTVTVVAERIDNPYLAPEQIDSALRACLTEHRPIYLEMPSDIFAQECKEPIGLIGAQPIPSATDLTLPFNPLESVIQQTIASLKAAKNPVIWGGIEIQRYGLQDQFESLLNRLNIPYVSSLLGKSIVSENIPQFAGVYDGNNTPDPIKELVNEADLFLAIGVWITDENLGGIPFPSDKIFLVARQAARYRSHYFPQVTLRDYLERLLLALEAETAISFENNRQIEQQQLSYQPTDTLTYDSFFDQMKSIVDDSMVVLADTGFSLYGASQLKIGYRSGFVAQAAWASIGYTGAAVVGVKLARPEKRPVVFIGDGAFQMVCQALSTIVHLGQNPIIFVMNNRGYGIEQWLTDPSYFANQSNYAPYSQLAEWNYSKLTEAFGGKGWTVTTNDELAKALPDILANDQTLSFVEVCVDQKSYPSVMKWKVENSK